MIALTSLLALATEPAPTPGTVEIELVRALDLGKRLVARGEGTRVFNFWATWCGPCKEEMPHLRAWAAAHPEIDVILVSLDLPKLKDAKVAPFVQSQGLQALEHWQLDDPDPAAALPRVIPDWPDTVPMTLVVNDEGTIVRRFHRALTESDMDAILESP